MNKRIIYTIFIIVITLLSSTLTKYEEINNLSIISNIEIKYENNKYKVIFQEIVPKQGDNKIKYEYKYTSITSSNIENCFKKIKNHSPKTIYLNKVQNIIINYKHHKKIINSLIKYDYEINKNSNIVITKFNTEDIFKIDNNYKYIESILKDKNITLKEIKKNKKIKIPLLIINNHELLFKKYIYL